MEDNLNHLDKNGGESIDNKGNLNPHLKKINEDALYHIGLTSGKQDLKKMFGDVKVSPFIHEMKDISSLQSNYLATYIMYLTIYTNITIHLIVMCLVIQFVCMGGTPHRMELFANYIGKVIDYTLPTGACLNDISKNSHRYLNLDKKLVK